MALPPREVSLPAEALQQLQAAVTRGGRDDGVRALHAAGYASGQSIHQRLVDALPGAPATLARGPFFDRLSRYFRDRGWGTFVHESPHPGVALLTSPDWIEAEGGGATDGAAAGCAFSAGVLAAVLTRVAGAPVAVLETGCRSRGDDRCTFAFGSEAAVQALYGALRRGETLAGALHALGRGGEH